MRYHATLTLLITCSLLATAESAPLRVGIKVAPPFVIGDGGGAEPGISCELWQLVAEGLGRETVYVQHDLAGLLAAVEAGDVDVAVAALTVTEEREAAFDFTHPFFSTGLGIASRDDGSVLKLALLTIVDPYFLGALGVLCMLLLSVGAVVWLLERRHNPAQFGRPGMGGLSDGFWWSAVTMTTVGYGDKAPVTPLGRLIAIWWMFASVFLVSAFTATVASSLTSSRLTSTVSGPADLHTVQSGVVAAATSEAYARDAGLAHRSYPTLEEALQALERKEVQAVIHDRPLLRYHVNSGAFEGLQVLPQLLRNEDYAFAVPDGSALREAINRALLKLDERGDFARIVERYLGTDA